MTVRMSWLVVCNTLLSGIGQVTKKYAELLGADFIQKGERPPKEHYERGFIFLLPFENECTLADAYSNFCDRMIYMTICETEPVNDAYRMLTKYKTLYVASEFCRDIFQAQYPDVAWKVLHLYADGPAVPRPPKLHGSYVFYSIGNMADYRKNISALLKAFYELRLPDTRLLLKATCLQDYKVDIPGVTVINGLLSDEQMENIHAQGDCYVNCSHSEGVGMGAVEAALRSKPVIITDYGGLKEYVQTPWVIRCTKGPIGFDDFLFKAEHQWGHPSYEELKAHMLDCYTGRVRTWDHAHTRGLMDQVKTQLNLL
jgi:glycosyltransferase involved in cell wall biosynthesis